MSNAEFVLEAVDITKTFPGVKALDGVSLRVKPGTVHALMGENGAGKSTLMKCIYGIYSPDAGTIRISGQKVEIENPRNAMDLGISMIHQELHPVRTQNVSENIFLGRLPYKKRAGVRWVDGWSGIRRRYLSGSASKLTRSRRYRNSPPPTASCWRSPGRCPSGPR